VPEPYEILPKFNAANGLQTLGPGDTLGPIHQSQSASIQSELTGAVG